MPPSSVMPVWASAVAGPGTRWGTRPGSSPAAPSSSTRSCGRRGPATDGVDGREVELEPRRRSPDPGPARATGPAPGVALDEVDELRRPAGQAQVGQGLVVDGEEGRRRPELGAHVRDRRPVREGQAREPVPGELDERTDDPEPAQHLGDDEHEVGRGRAARELPGEAHADDPGHGLVERLAEEDGLGLDAADAVPEHAEPVDHRRVGVGPHERVRERDAVTPSRR